MFILILVPVLIWAVLFHWQHISLDLPLWSRFLLSILRIIIQWLHYRCLSIRILLIISWLSSSHQGNCPICYWRFILTFASFEFYLRLFHLLMKKRRNDRNKLLCILLEVGLLKLFIILKGGELRMMICSLLLDFWGLI